VERIRSHAREHARAIAQGCCLGRASQEGSESCQETGEIRRAERSSALEKRSTGMSNPSEASNPSNPSKDLSPAEQADAFEVLAHDPDPAVVTDAAAKKASVRHFSWHAAGEGARRELVLARRIAPVRLSSTGNPGTEADRRFFAMSPDEASLALDAIESEGLR